MIPKLRLFPYLRLLIAAYIFYGLPEMLSAQVPVTSGSDRLKSIGQRKLLQQRSLLQETRFRNIGPSIMGGRVVDLDVNPDDPTEFYVAYATGGLWHTTNNGQSFIPVFDTADVITIGDISIEWKSRTLWVGTGEVNSSRSSYAGIGLYKSRDNGRTWEYLGLPDSHHIGKILLHPNDPQTAWVAAMGHLYSSNKERGVYKTTDGGKTWAQVLFIDENTGAIDLDLNPSSPDELYAAMWHRTRSAWNFEEGGATSGIYKSNDGGAHWQLLTTENSGFPSGSHTGRIGIAVYPGNPSVLYAVVDNQSPKPDTTAKQPDTLYRLADLKDLTQESFEALDDKKLGQFLKRNRFPAKYSAAGVKELVRTGKQKPTVLYDYLNVNDGFVNTGIYGCQLYKSNDGGRSWSRTNEKDIPVYSTYGYYFGKVYVSPYNDQKVILFGVSLQLSTDGGKTFRNIDKENVHGDHHAIWINPKRDSHILNGNDGGANITYDDGAHWFKCNTPPVGQYYSVSTDNDSPYNVYGGLQDNNVWYGPSTNKENIGWIDNGEYPYKSLVGGDGMQVQIDTRDNKTVYAGSQFGYYVRMNRLERGHARSVRPVHDLGEPPLRFNWETPILLSRHNQDVFYIGSNKFHRSLDKGDSLVALSGDLTNGKKEGDVPFGTLTCIAESPLKFGLLYTGTDDGNIYCSRDGGYTWVKISHNLPQGLWVSHITASRYSEGRVYLSLNGYRNDHFLPYLYVSEDYGTTWKPIGLELPFEPLNVVREDPKYDSILYVGSDGGIYVSLNNGENFMAWTAGLPSSVPVHDIAIQERENELVLGTHGRSLYIAPLGPVQQLKNDPENRHKKEAEAMRRMDDATGTDPNLFNRSELEVKPGNKKKTKR